MTCPINAAPRWFVNDPHPERNRNVSLVSIMMEPA